MAVVASSLTSTETQATSGSLWAMAHLLHPNWREPIVTKTAFLSEVIAAKSDSEQRRGFFGKPVHTSEFSALAASIEQLSSLQASMVRAGMARELTPLHSDTTFLTSEATSATINCDTRTRRFFLGARVLLVEARDNSFQVCQITGKTDSTLTLSPDPLGGVFKAGSRVVPLIEGMLRLSDRISVVTDRVAEASITSDELPGKWTLDLVQAIGSTPFGVSEYDGFPILSTPINFVNGVQLSLQRTGNYSGSGTSQIATLDGTRSRIGQTLPYLFDSREGFWKMLQFFESRAGRLLPFWLASASSDFTFVAFGTGTVQVAAKGPSRDWDYRKHIALIGRDGTTQIRAIESVSRSGNIDTITLDSGFTEVAVERLAVARLCRFVSDEMIESWYNLETCAVNLEAIELTREEEVSIANLVERTTQGLPAEFDPFLSGGSSGISAPMFYHPCRAPTERRAGRAASLLLPQTFEVEIAGDFTEDESFPITAGGSVSAELLAALPGTYRCTYDDDVGGDSGHWHHLTVCSLPPSYVTGFCHPGDDLEVARHRWRATKDYTKAGGGTATITVDFVVEWSDDGAAGALFNIYVYSSEVNSSYVDGVAFAARGDRAFTKDNPAIYPPIAGGPETDKWCHPQMLVCASIPTSWTAPCDNQGYSCSDTAVVAGFSDCLAVLNGAPWVANNEYECRGNVVFQADEEFHYARAMTLGGGCPQSDLFGHVIIENGTGGGITALVPGRSGWYEAFGTLDVLGGSSITVRACLPPQTAARIDCCDGPSGVPKNNPDCWRPGDAAPNVCDPPDPERPDSKCCFPTDSIVTLRVTQKCTCITVNFDSECIATGPECPDNPFSICGTRTKEYTLPVCEATFGETERSITWAVEVPDPIYNYRNAIDDFDDVDVLGWAFVEGDWSIHHEDNGLLLSETASSDPLTPRACLLGDNQYVNFSAEIDCLSAGAHGFFFRSTLIDEVDGYAVIADPSAGTLKVVFIDRDEDEIVLLGQTTGLTFSAPYRLRVSVRGNRFSVSIDDNPLLVASAEDCRRQTAGYMGILAGANASFDNFEIDDGDYTTITVKVWYDDDGWGIDVPKGGMPYDQDAPTACQTTNPDCGVSICSCTKVSKGTTPESIFVTQTDDPQRLVLPGKPKPWSGQGGPECEADCVGCDGKTTCAKFHDFLAATVRVSSSCVTKPCPDGSSSNCVGVDFWHGQCNG